MTTRELLELAARAAGMTGWEYCEPWGGMARRNSLGEYFGPVWRPHADDGDALRLAVDLHLKIECMVGQSAARNFPNTCAGCITHTSSLDKYAATRLAIVRAAAEMGRGM